MAGLRRSIISGPGRHAAQGETTDFLEGRSSSPDLREHHLKKRRDSAAVELLLIRRRHVRMTQRMAPAATRAGAIDGPLSSTAVETRSPPANQTLGRVGEVSGIRVLPKASEPGAGLKRSHVDLCSAFLNLFQAEEGAGTGARAG
ncbi:MAG: hypothetical protein R3C20_25210, partial [Planctomycetaceae bacterium]